MSSIQKRDLIAELKAFAGRQDVAFENGDPVWTRYNELVGAYCAIDNLDSTSILKPELHRHVVVSLVAVAQSAVRQTIGRIVDYKEENGEELPELRDVKLTLAMARELKKQSFSFGELLAHFLPVSGVESISASLKHVCGQDLRDIMRSRLHDIHLPLRPKTLTTEERLNERWKTLLELFSFRNIYAHEEGVGTVVSPEQLYNFVIAILALLGALADFQIKFCVLPGDRLKAELQGAQDG